MKALMAGCVPGPTLLSRFFTFLTVRSGFCSDPEKMNSLSAIVLLSTNHEYPCPVRPMWATLAKLSPPGMIVEGRRLPSASIHSEDGPGMMRMPCMGQTESQFCMPSGYAHMRSVLVRRAPADSEILIIRPSTYAGTPHTMSAGASPQRSTGHARRTRSRFPPMPPDVTTTACPRSSNEPATSRFEAIPRSEGSSAKTLPRTPTTRVPSGVASVMSSSTWRRKRKVTLPSASNFSNGSLNTRTTSGPVPHVRWKRGTELPCPEASPEPRSAQPTVGSTFKPRDLRYSRFSWAAKRTYSRPQRRGQ